MTIRHLRIFSVVCQKESITKAADFLNMAQPAVSNAIRELESFYEVKLFERMNRRIYLTAAGESLLHYATSILSQFDEAKDLLQDIAAATQIRIGSNISFGVSFLPKLLSGFMSVHPEIPVYSMVENSSRIENSLLHNELDFAIVDNLVSSSHFHQRLIMTEKMVAVCSPDFPCLQKILHDDTITHPGTTMPKPEISLSDCASIPMLLRESGSGTRELIQHQFHHANVTPLIAMESISPQALVEFCLKGLGMLILPISFLKPYLDSGKLVEIYIKNLSFSRNYYVVYHKSKYITKGMSYFLNYLSKDQKENSPGR